MTEFPKPSDGLARYIEAYDLKIVEALEVKCFRNFAEDYPQFFSGPEWIVGISYKYRLSGFDDIMTTIDTDFYVLPPDKQILPPHLFGA
jgi:hypothetical protein